MIFKKQMDMESHQAAALLLYRRRQNRKIKRRFWVHDIHLARDEYGEFHQLIARELALDEDCFFQYFRMCHDQFDELLAMVGPLIKKESTNFRKPIYARERLCVCLRYVSFFLFQSNK